MENCFLKVKKVYLQFHALRISGQDKTQKERNLSFVNFVIKHSTKQHTWRHIWEYTRAKDLLPVLFVQSCSSRLVIWNSIWNYILWIGPTVACFVLKRSPKTVLCRLIWGLIQVWNCTAVPDVKKYLLQNMPKRNIFTPATLQRRHVAVRSVENHSQCQASW